MLSRVRLLLHALLFAEVPTLLLQESHRHLHCSAAVHHVFLTKHPLHQHDDFVLDLDPDMGVMHRRLVLEWFDLLQDLIAKHKSLFRTSMVTEVNAFASRFAPAARVDVAHGTLVVFEEVCVGDGEDVVLCLELWCSHVVDCVWWNV